MALPEAMRKAPTACKLAPLSLLLKLGRDKRRRVDTRLTYLKGARDLIEGDVLMSGFRHDVGREIELLEKEAKCY